MILFIRPFVSLIFKLSLSLSYSDSANDGSRQLPQAPIPEGRREGGLNAVVSYVRFVKWECSVKDIPS